MPGGPAKMREVRKRLEANPRRPVLLKVLKRLEATRTRAMKAPFARAPSAATITEEMREVSPLAGARASVAAADPEAAVVAGDDRILSYTCRLSLDVERCPMQRTNLNIDKW